MKTKRTKPPRKPDQDTIPRRLSEKAVVDASRMVLNTGALVLADPDGPFKFTDEQVEEWVLLTSGRSLERIKNIGKLVDSIPGLLEKVKENE